MNKYYVFIVNKGALRQKFYFRDSEAEAITLQKQLFSDGEKFIIFRSAAYIQLTNF